MEKIKYIEGIKGLSIVVVLLHHYILGFYPALISGYPEMSHTQTAIEVWIAKTPLNLLYNGNFAVCIFFIISGYMLSHKFFRAKKHDYIVASASKRYFRLLLPVLFSILIAYMCMKLNLFYNRDAALYSKSTLWLSTLWQFDPNFWGMINEGFYGVFVTSSHSYNSFLWIITFEFIGSYLVFGVVSLFGHQRNRFIFYFLLIFLLFNTYFILFILGLIVSDLKINSPYFIKYKRSIHPLLFLLIGLYLGSYPTNLAPSLIKESFLYRHIFNQYIDQAYLFAHTWGALLVLLAVLSSERLQRFLSNTILSFLGKIAYSLFVIHGIILGTFSSWLFLKLSYLPYHIDCLIMFFVSWIIVVIISYVVFQYIDRPGIRLSNRLYEIIFEPKHQALSNQLESKSMA